MPAADSSFSRPSSSEGLEIAVTLSLDGVVLESSVGSRSLSEIAQHPFDRLVVTPDEILAVDFKTNAVVPDTPNSVPDGILRQMGAYTHALAQIYPTKRIETAIVWTRTGHLMDLPAEITKTALDARHREDDVTSHAIS